jgi:hypothetical protein
MGYPFGPPHTPDASSTRGGDIIVAPRLVLPTDSALLRLLHLHRFAPRAVDLRADQ